jgi:hypothetical protein
MNSSFDPILLNAGGAATVQSGSNISLNAGGNMTIFSGGSLVDITTAFEGTPGTGNAVAERIRAGVGS